MDTQATIIPPLQSVHVPANATLTINPSEYVLDSFESLIATSIDAETLLKKNVRLHLYRKTLRHVLEQELALSLPCSLNQLYQLTIRCFERLRFS